MNKREILQLVCSQIESDLGVLTRSAIEAREAAIHTESKAEDQYDTRGLEASYLAGAQSKRAMELEETLQMFRNLDLISFSESTPIAATALVELQSDDKKSFCFLMPKGGGLTVKYEGKSIQIVTPQSPLGESLLGQKVGAEFEVRIQNKLKDFLVTKVW